MIFVVDKDSEDKELRKAYKYLLRYGKMKWKLHNQIRLPKNTRRLKRHIEFITRRIGQCCCHYTGHESLVWTSHHFGKSRWFFEVKQKVEQDESV